MKNIILFLALSSTILLTSCTGEQGPPGGLVYANIFETTVNSYQYDAVHNEFYSNTVSFPFTVYESDAVLVYRLSGSDNVVNPPADVWTQLPQSIFYNDGTGDFFQYNFNSTFLSVQFTIEGNFPLSNIANEDITNQVFRVAVVPAQFAKTNPSMEKLLEVMEANDTHVQTIENNKQ
ncbi:hypothetical protein EI546_02065 [Aequorivita sp. H23M31]|uniref:Dihydrolipoamide dehydrogenase n=1 Tax=Aequorivita ciconiae TaxID=2494375 RepID=A0A410FZZ0_9FLAO|nr:hypothetical protein [Aequorivita sp. H23M31]QAA80588.1 hypothetical protein EI546_02065 [Aequorivita sp. H23M31]